MSICRSCGARIRWAITAATGARAPLDAEPSPDGNVRVVPGAPDLAYTVGATIDMLDPTDDGTRYMPHHATCPDADQWRRRWRRR